jgi:hypothetical protein
MKSTADGISLSRVELTALLAFASQEEADKNKWGVHFHVKGDSVRARAMNGFASFELTGINLGRSDQEWMVGRKFLVDAQKPLGTKQVLRLEFAGASLHEGTVLENDKKLGMWQSDDDASIRQVSFPWETDELSIPAERRKIAHCSAISTPYLKLVMLAAQAVDVEVAHFYSPAAAAGPMIFTVGHDKDTSGLGLIKPLPVEVVESNENDEAA